MNPKTNAPDGGVGAAEANWASAKWAQLQAAASTATAPLRPLTTSGLPGLRWSTQPSSSDASPIWAGYLDQQPALTFRLPRPSLSTQPPVRRDCRLRLEPFRCLPSPPSGGDLRGLQGLTRLPRRVRPSSS